MIHISELTSCFLGHVKLLMFQHDRSLVMKELRRWKKTITQLSVTWENMEMWQLKKKARSSRCMLIKNSETSQWTKPLLSISYIFANLKSDTNRGTLNDFIYSINIWHIFTSYELQNKGICYWSGTQDRKPGGSSFVPRPLLQAISDSAGLYYLQTHLQFGLFSPCPSLALDTALDSCFSLLCFLCCPPPLSSTIHQKLKWPRCQLCHMTPPHWLSMHPLKIPNSFLRLCLPLAHQKDVGSFWDQE